MDRFHSIVSKVAKLEVRTDDDWCDRLCHRYTTIVLVIFAIVVSTKQYVGDPITCWCPASFTSQHVQYTDDVCWISNTYYHPMHHPVPRENEPPDFEVTYYQWVPMFLLIQAVLFYIPNMLWHVFNDKAGVNIHNIIDAASILAQVYSDSREKTMKYLLRHMDRYLDSNREYRNNCLIRIKQFLSQNCCMFCGKRYGNYLIVLYLVIKLFYLTNVIGQLFLLNAFLGTKYNMYGFSVLRDLANGSDWQTSEVFPRVTLCSFKIRTLGNVQRHTVQCVLPINLFNEKIYIFIWFWYVFVAISVLGNFLQWFWHSFRVARIRYIKKHLKVMDRITGEADKKLFQKFTERYLRQDGYLILRLISKNVSDLVVAEVIAGLWDNYKRNKPMTLRGGTDDESNI